MVKIWYSVCGEGMGHAIRSEVVINYLKTNNQIMITAYDKAYNYLKNKKTNNLHKIKGNRYVYENNKINNTKSVLFYIIRAPIKIIYNTFKLIPLIGKFKPDIIISDFESAAHFYSKVFNIPCIDIDNIHAQTDCKIKNIKEPFYIKPIIRFLHPKATKQIITSFCNIKPINKNKTIVTKPIIRKEIENSKIKNKNFVLVYQTSTSNKQMLPVLKKSKNKFKIYGMKNPNNQNINNKITNKIKNQKNKNNISNNLEFCKFSEKQFIKDLAECKYVILNGGFTTISEAIYLKKPIISIPVKNQFEQEFNAHCIKEAGYGIATKKLKQKNLINFEKNLKKYKTKLNQNPKWDNKSTFKKITELISKLTKQK